MKILIKINEGLLAPQLPDEQQFFQKQEIVYVENKKYLFCEYTGEKPLKSDYNVNAYLAQTQQADNGCIKLLSIQVTSTNAALNGNIWWIPKNEPFTFTADAEGLPDGELMVMVERVVNATQPVDDLRFIASIKNGKITMNGIFEQSGNYLVTETRLNEGLERINAPFRLSLPRIEFDAYVPAKASSTLSSTMTATGFTDKAKQLASKLTGQSSV